MSLSMATRWKLREVMARHGVTVTALAQELGIKPASVSNMRGDEMPRINGQRLDQIAKAVTALSKRGEVVYGIDLLENEKDCDNA